MVDACSFRRYCHGGRGKALRLPRPGMFKRTNEAQHLASRELMLFAET